MKVMKMILKLEKQFYLKKKKGEFKKLSFMFFLFFPFFRTQEINNLIKQLKNAKNIRDIAKCAEGISIEN